ncbi:hypothetical protein VNO78_18892 [Psophocarpus tetragonolobus]|uniref:Uncharacterized protein n=1 Tax=Psophocarpus tetragonolobus TaxID=3891 RepID=A0AAN9SBD9_PSOTE
MHSPAAVVNEIIILSHFFVFSVPKSRQENMTILILKCETCNYSFAFSMVVPKLFLGCEIIAYCTKLLIECSCSFRSVKLTTERCRFMFTFGEQLTMLQCQYVSWVLSHDRCSGCACLFMMNIKQCDFGPGTFWRFVPKLYDDASVLCFLFGWATSHNKHVPFVLVHLSCKDCTAPHSFQHRTQPVFR